MKTKLKGYDDYMNNINSDPALHGKIMKQLTGKASNSRTKRPVLRYAAVAACVAVIAFAVWMLPGILSNQPVQNGGVGIADPRDPSIAYVPNGDLYPLTFNEAESMMSASLMPRPGYFDYDITTEQLNAMFPGLSAILSATEDVHYQSFGAAAFYRPDGSLEFASVSESIIDYDMRVSQTDIRVSDGVIPDSTILFYGEGATIYSDVHGVSVAAFMHVSTWDGRAPDSVFLRADFVLGGLNYRVTFNGENLAEGQEHITEIVNWLIALGPVDLSILADPIIPELRNEQLTIDQAMQEPIFGAFLPANIPEDLVFISASRVLDTRVNFLLVHFNHNDPWQFSHSISWMVATPTEHDLQNIVSVNDLQKFDVSLYPIPWMDSVPREYFNYFQSPVFLASEISLEAVQARTRLAGGDRTGGGTAEWQTDQFAVLFEDVIVQISANGLSAEQIWDMIQEVKAVL